MGIAFLKTSAFEGRKYISLALTHFQNDGYPIWKGARNAQVIYVVSYLTQVYLLLLYCRLTILMIIIIQKERQSYSWKLLLLFFHRISTFLLSFVLQGIEQGVISSLHSKQRQSYSWKLLLLYIFFHRMSTFLLSFVL